MLARVLINDREGMDTPLGQSQSECLQLKLVILYSAQIRNLITESFRLQYESVQAHCHSMTRITIVSRDKPLSSTLQTRDQLTKTTLSGRNQEGFGFWFVMSSHHEPSHYIKNTYNWCALMGWSRILAQWHCRNRLILTSDFSYST